LQGFNDFEALHKTIEADEPAVDPDDFEKICPGD
jgi:hypothetical protein